MSEAVSGYARLDDQIAWFDDRSRRHQVWYRRLKILSIAAAALVPFVSSLEGYAVLAGLLGVVVVVVEGLQHVNQHHENWIRYRATCENLRHEKFLYLARAGHFADLDDDEALRLLTEQVESILSFEGREWARRRRQVESPTAKGGKGGKGGAKSGKPGKPSGAPEAPQDGGG